MTSEAIKERWKFEFGEWMKDVDNELYALSGLNHRDLADQAWAGWFDDGMRPQDAAELALEEEGI